MTLIKKRLIFTLFIISFKAFGQAYHIDFQTSTLSNYIDWEVQQGSERIESSENYISFNDEAQPIKFLRKEEGIPDLIVTYYFKAQDSSITHIYYEWDVYNFEKQDNNQKPEKFQKAMIAKHQALSKSISDIYGQPIIRRNYSNISRLDPDNVFEESAKWSPNEQVQIVLSTTLSNFYKKLFKINPLGCKGVFLEPDFVKFIARSAAMRSKFDFIRTQ